MGVLRVIILFLKVNRNGTSAECGGHFGISQNHLSYYTYVPDRGCWPLTFDIWPFPSPNSFLTCHWSSGCYYRKEWAPNLGEFSFFSSLHISNCFRKTFGGQMNKLTTACSWKAPYKLKGQLMFYTNASFDDVKSFTQMNRSWSWNDLHASIMLRMKRYAQNPTCEGFRVNFGFVI